MTIDEIMSGPSFNKDIMARFHKASIAAEAARNAHPKPNSLGGWAASSEAHSEVMGMNAGATLAKLGYGD